MLEQDQNMLKNNYRNGFLVYAHVKKATRFLWLHLSVFMPTFIGIVMRILTLSYTLYIFEDFNIRLNKINRNVNESQITY